MNPIFQTPSGSIQYTNANTQLSRSSLMSSTVNEPEQQDLSTLQVILEKKNRVIDKLKKQVHNQRIQLEFYIKKEMNSPLMVELAKTCLPELTNENMTVTLAMNKFYRELGMKSRIGDLHDRVDNLTGRTNCIIQTQETLLNEIIYNMQECMSPLEIEMFLGNFDVNTNYIELFNNLFEATTSLKTSLNSFKKCCDKLANVEDKRTEIVEQVYSLPQEERTICNYLVNIQMEKYELENVLERIKKQNKILPPVADKMDIIEKNLKLLHKTFENKFENDNEADYVSNMLKKVYKQAMSLLSLSREQREKYTTEVEQLRDENDKLQEIIQHIDLRTASPTSDADFKDIQKLHNVIKKTISESRKFEKTKTEELKQKSLECENLKRKLSEVVMQKRQLQNLLSTNSAETIEVFDF